MQINTAVGVFFKNARGFFANTKLPLALAVLAQSFLVFLYLAEFTYGEIPLLKIIIAVLTAVALDAMIIQTTFTERSTWGILTSIVALIGGILISLSVMYQLNYHWLHIVFPILVWTFSQHLNTLPTKRKYTKNAINGIKRNVQKRKRGTN